LETTSFVLQCADGTSVLIGAGVTAHAKEAGLVISPFALTCRVIHARAKDIGVDSRGASRSAFASVPRAAKSSSRMTGDVTQALTA